MSHTGPGNRRWKFGDIRALCATTEPGDGIRAVLAELGPSPISSSLDSRRAQKKTGVSMILLVFNLEFSKIPLLESLLSSSNRALELCHSSFTECTLKGRLKSFFFQKENLSAQTPPLFGLP